MDDVQQLNNVRVLHFFEQRDLADSGARDTFIFGLESYFFQSDNTARVVQLAGLVDDTVCAYRRTDEPTRELSSDRSVSAIPKTASKSVRTFADFLNFLVIFHGDLDI
jgi:hypothetical protein